MTKITVIFGDNSERETEAVFSFLEWQKDGSYEQKFDHKENMFYTKGRGQPVIIIDWPEKPFNTVIIQGYQKLIDYWNKMGLWLC